MFDVMHMMEELESLAHLIALTNHSPWDSGYCFYCHCEHPRHFSNCIYEKAAGFVMEMKKRYG